MNNEITILLKALIQFSQVKNIGVEILDPKLLNALLKLKLINEVQPNTYVASDYLTQFVNKTNLTITENLLKENI